MPGEPWPGTSTRWGAEEFLRGLWQGAVKVEPARLAFSPQVRRSGIRIANTSAIPFQLK
jgi:hypothetical protein